MKIRIDFVTNSSSSSFILARKGEITEEQKNAVIDYIVKKMLGEKILASDDVKSNEAELDAKVAKLAETDYWVGEMQDEIKEALKSGKDIYMGTVDHERADGYYCDLFEDIWGILEKNGQGNFEAIQDDLSY